MIRSQLISKISLLLPFGLCLALLGASAQIDPAVSREDPRHENTKSVLATAGSQEAVRSYGGLTLADDDRELRMGPYSRDDAFIEDFSAERAAQFLDRVALTWGKKHGCVTCHTNGYYLTAPTTIFGNRPAFRSVREHAERFVESWDPERLPGTDLTHAGTTFALKALTDLAEP